ncbi:PilZ domain-containing protein [Desulfoplanes sp.]
MNFLAKQSIFSGQFRDSFASTGINAELIIVLAWVVGCALGILGVGIVYRLVSARLRRPKPLGSVENPNEIIDLLGICLARRTRFEMMFKGNVIKSKGIFCTLVSVDADNMLLELPGYASPRRGWVGRSIEVFFSLAHNTKAPTFYTFESTVQAIEPQGQGINHLRTELPPTIRLGQRRMHFRFAPPPSSITETKIWFFRHEPRQKDHAGPSTWGQPMGNHHTGTEGSSLPGLAIKDISAGGCRIVLKDNERAKTYLQNNRSPDVFIFLRLADPGGTDLRLYLLGKIQLLLNNQVTKEVTMGMEFTMHGTVENSLGSRITWRPLLQEEGHPKVGNWVFKHHVDLFRQQEQDKQDWE